MHPLIFALCVLFAFGSPSTQKSHWQPSPGHTQVPIWPGKVPDARPVTGPETFKITGKKELVAGRPWAYVGSVSQSTMTFYAPKGKNTGTVVVVFPGGGYQILAMDLEGTEVCDWLTSQGITAVLLKYRVPGEGNFRNRGPTQALRKRWRMRSGQSGWCASMPPSGTSTRTRSGCLGFRRAAIW